MADTSNKCKCKIQATDAKDSYRQTTDASAGYKQQMQMTDGYK